MQVRVHPLFRYILEKCHLLLSCRRMLKFSLHSSVITGRGKTKVNGVAQALQGHGILLFMVPLVRHSGT